MAAPWQLLQAPLPLTAATIGTVAGQSDASTLMGNTSAVVVQKLPLLALMILSFLPLASVTLMVPPSPK